MKKIFTTTFSFSIAREISVIISFALLASVKLHSQDTFSIVAVDPETGEVGSAGASCLGAQFGAPEGCILISDVHPGVGAIHTQAYYLLGNQNYAKALMDSGYSPHDIIDSVVANDVQNNPLIRQYGVVDFTGAAGYTGSNCDDYKNHITGSTYAIQGNILLGQQILDSMQARFLNTPGPLACKLMSALQGANVPGADTRCLDEGISSLSAFVRVAKPADTLGTLTLDLNVKSVPDDWSVDPIDSLQKLFDEAVKCASSGVNPLYQPESVHVSPNPAHDRIAVNSAIPFREIELYDLAGRRLWQGEYPTISAVEIKLDNAFQGLFFLKVLFADETSTLTKLTIQ